MDKPPVGLQPRIIHEALRREEILAACVRYDACNTIIPEEWIEELSELNKKPRTLHEKA